MAVLKDLIVHGASRFLNKSYFNSLEADSGAFKKIIAKDATVTNATVMGLLDVTGELHTKSWSNSNIATIDGSFYITPTFGLQGGDTSTNTVTVAATSLSFTNSSGTNFNFDSLYLDGSDNAIAWTTSSKVIVTGEILKDGEWIPLGTLKGTLGTYSTTSVVINNITDAKGAAPATLAALIGSGLRYRNVKVSLISINRSGLKPLGIFMTATGANGRTFLDIYGGNNAESSTYAGLSTPVLRIGNLKGLPAIQGVTPSGWGIYTTNGFFSGTVAADRGKIGGWNIGTDTNKSLYTGTFNSSGGVYISPSYSGTLSVASGAKNWAFTAGNAFGVTTAGILYASGAQIQGDLKANTLATGTKISSTSGNGFYVDSSGNIYVGNGSTNNFTVTAAGTLNATGAVFKNVILKDGSNNTRACVDANGLIVYDGVGTNADNTVSQFTSSGVTIGKTGATHVDIKSNSLEVTDKDAITFFKVRDAVNESGQVVDTFSGDGSKTEFKLTHTAANTSYTVTQNGTTVSPNKTLEKITFSTAPAAGDQIVITYNVTGNSAKGYDFGVRKSGTITGDYSVIEGYNTTASGEYSHAEGEVTTASREASHAEGFYTTASGYYSHAEGSYTVASGSYSHAEGYDARAIGNSSHAEGYGTRASGPLSHAGGDTTKATGIGSHVEGKKTIASNSYSHAEGEKTSASGSASHAEGRYTKAQGIGSHAEGYGYDKTNGAYGEYSHSEGENTMAIGNYAHSEGSYTEANGTASHAEGFRTEANGDYSHVEGKYNIPDNNNTYAFIIGNGSSNSARSNALTVSWNGTITITDSRFDLSKTDNNTSSTLYPTTANITDSAGRIATRLEGVVNSNGSMGAYWYVKNYNTSGTAVAQKGISMSMDKSGTLTYGVSDAAKFRSAIGAISDVKAVNYEWQVSPAFSAGSKLFDASLTNSSVGSIPTGYTFLGWSVFCSKGWVGAIFPSDPSYSNTAVWTASTKPATSGTSIRALAFFIKA